MQEKDLYNLWKANQELYQKFCAKEFLLLLHICVDQLKLLVIT